ncbi:MAG: hypothetical protein J6K19_07985 [Prevotella sp.]|nr:hypothetical protein [Prevotella sp.]
MRKLLLSIAFALTSFCTANGQEVYNEIKNSAANIVSDPTTNDMVRQINQFKMDALDYLLVKMREQMPDSSATFLDKEAYAMNNFVNFFIQEIIKNKDMPQAHQVKIMKLFMDASFSNPLFEDPEKDITLIYYADEKCLTRFSLDTDWRKAVAAIVMEMKDNL